MTYAVSYQHAHHDHSQSADLGIMESADVLRAFDELGWSQQVVEASRLGKCAPTLSVTVPSTGRLIWVSAYGDQNPLMFVSECRFPGKNKALFGLAESSGIVDLDIQTFRMSDARRALELFMSDADSELRALYAKA